MKLESVDLWKATDVCLERTLRFSLFERIRWASYKSSFLSFDKLLAAAICQFGNFNFIVLFEFLEKLRNRQKFTKSHKFTKHGFTAFRKIFRIFRNSSFTDSGDKRELCITGII